MSIYRIRIVRDNGINDESIILHSFNSASPLAAIRYFVRYVRQPEVKKVILENNPKYLILFDQQIGISLINLYTRNRAWE